MKVLDHHTHYWLQVEIDAILDTTWEDGIYEGLSY